MYTSFTWLLLLYIPSISMRTFHFDGDLLTLPSCPKLAGVLLLLLTFNCFDLTGGDTSPTCFNGIIEPREPYFWIGENFTLTCRARFNITGTLMFNISRQELFEIWTDSSANAVQLIGLLKPGNENQWGFMVRCMEETESRKSCLENVYMNFEYRPVKPINVKLRILDWEMMWLTWDLGQKYINDKNVQVECNFLAAAIYRRNGARQYVPCPLVNSTTCYWNASMYTDSDKYYTKIIVTNNITNVTATAENEFERDFHVEPKIQIVTVKETDPGCVYIKWRAPLRSGLHFLYNLSYNSDCGDSMEKHILIKFENRAVRVVNTTLCNLTANNNYTFKVQGSVYKNMTAVGYWSKPSTRTLRLKSQVPTLSPSWTRGLYEYINDEIRVYYKLLDICDLNANIGWYTISSGAKILKEVQHPNFFVTVPQKLMINNTYILLFLQTNNPLGLSTKATQVTLFSKDKMLTPSHMHVEYSPLKHPSCRNIFINIRLLEKNARYANFSHTLVYCVGKTICKSELIWKDISSVYEMQDCNDYRYGLITKAYDGHAHATIETQIEWNECLYQHKKVAQIQKEMFSIEGNQSPGKVKIEWNLPPCNPAYIEQFYIRYCPEENKDCTCAVDSKFETVTGTQQSHTLEKLTVKKICVWFEARNPNGMSSPVLLGPVDILLIHDAVPWGVIIGVIVLSALVVVIAFFLKRSLLPKSKIEIKDIEKTPGFPSYLTKLRAMQDADPTDEASLPNDSENGSLSTRGSQEEGQPLIGPSFPGESAVTSSNLPITTTLSHRAGDLVIESHGDGPSSEHVYNYVSEEIMRSAKDLEDKHCNHILVLPLLESDDIIDHGVSPAMLVHQDTSIEEEEDCSIPVLEPQNDTNSQTTENDFDSEKSETLCGYSRSAESCLDGYEVAQNIVFKEDLSYPSDVTCHSEGPIPDDPHQQSPIDVSLENTDTINATETCRSGSKDINSTGSESIEPVQNQNDNYDAMHSHRQNRSSVVDGYINSDITLKEESSYSCNSMDSGYAQAVSRARIATNKQDILCPGNVADMNYPFYFF